MAIFQTRRQNVIAERVSDLLDHARTYDDLPQWMKDKYTKDKVVIAKDYMIIEMKALTRDYIIVRYENQKVWFFTSEQFKRDFEPKK